MTALFALLYAVIFVIGVWFLPSSLVGLFLMIGITLLMVLFQYGISPLIIGWMFRIDWIPYEDFARRFPLMADSLNKVVDVNGIKMPRLGIIHDLNPNAFTYGWTKNSARVVLTDGILKHLNKKEQNAVFAHELGHVVHSDFIIMTLVFAIPLVLLSVARWAFYASYFSRRSSSDSESASYLRIALIVIAVLSYLSYYIAQLISLIVSRIREYYADEHAAEVCNDPNPLSTGLVKIAYGLMIDKEVEVLAKSRVRALRGMGIFDPRAARGLGIISVGASGTFTKEAVQAAAAWDLYNPWAKYYQARSTHPLPAKRILRLNQQCENYGVKPEIDFTHAKEIKEEQAGKSMLDEFLSDVFIKLLPTLIFIAMIGITILWIFDLVGFLTATLTLSNLILFWAIGFYIIGFGSIIKTRYMYKTGFEAKRVVELVTNIKVSPVRTVPAIVEGKIIGKGIPGYYFSNDMYFQDDTGLMYIDDRFGIGIVDLIHSFSRVRKLMGQRVRIKGWYRRGPIPYIQVNTIEVIGTERRYKNYARHLRFLWAVLEFSIGLIILYFWFRF